MDPSQLAGLAQESYSPFCCSSSCQIHGVFYAGIDNLQCARPLNYSAASALISNDEHELERGYHQDASSVRTVSEPITTLDAENQDQGNTDQPGDLVVFVVPLEEFVAQNAEHNIHQAQVDGNHCSRNALPSLNEETNENYVHVRRGRGGGDRRRRNRRTRTRMENQLAAIEERIRRAQDTSVVLQDQLSFWRGRANELEREVQERLAGRD
ncbi:hypothetical protein CYLTODRAFT_417779 [Cylindrobasidium torrendii FP15055 ss-10]|uniref:Uncharacterized protein n=1 Tax=Cylindrobasidium torrendii FP15055 ss-10 TaxID=1314674 RepID=A0A0D7BQQ2_9AGAR|nr:hypothetical protein CYLTODRAFT_417779 [Cylindrobasidium torrendii FP15055 ss-10]